VFKLSNAQCSDVMPRGNALPWGSFEADFYCLGLGLGLGLGG